MDVAPAPTIRIGTCGFSYADWKGPFYPPTIRPAEMLHFYAQRFSAVEIDSTYYRVPPPASFEAMAARTPATFRFSAKLPATGTHIANPQERRVHADVHVFRRNLEPLVAARKFAAALMQFPNSFHPGDSARAHIAALREALPDIPLVAEFRNREWQTNDTLELLRELGIGWVNVDMPQFDSLLRPSADATGPIGYVRFHGRNYQQWWKGDNVTRYDYEYGADELGPWADRLIDITANPDVREVLGFFNNHRRGQAARNAQMFEAMLRTRFPGGDVVTADSSTPTASGEQLSFDLADGP